MVDSTVYHRLGLGVYVLLNLNSKEIIILCAYRECVLICRKCIASPISTTHFTMQYAITIKVLPSTHHGCYPHLGHSTSKSN